MRAGCKRSLALAAGVITLAGCSGDVSGQCFDGFCLPADAVIVGNERTAYSKLYQVAWRDEQFGLYLGDNPTFDAASSRSFAAPLDSNAKLVAGGGSAELVMRLGSTSPRYLHLAGRCNDIDTCTLGELAHAITREN